MSKKPVVLLSLIVGLIALMSSSAFGLVYDIRIATGMDDVEEHLGNGDIDPTSSDLEIPYEDAGNPATDEQHLGLRYINVPLTKGADIRKAYIEIEADAVDKQGSANPVNLIIEGQLSPNAEAFLDATKNLTNRTSRTVAKVKWTIPAWTAVDSKWQSPDISAIIREIVTQNGWAAGNALVLIIRDDKDNPSTGLREAEAYDGEAGAAPLLHIEVFNPTAVRPDPADGAPAATTPMLQWTPGDSAIFHNVYVGTSPELTEADLKASRQMFNLYYHVQGFTPGTTYYWRVDEIDAAGTVVTGTVWRFTVAPVTAYNPNPRNTDKWIPVDVTLQWLGGQGAVSHEVFIGTDQAAVAARDASTSKGSTVAPSYVPGALQQNTTYYWAVDETDNSGGKQKGAVWSFTTISPGGGIKAEYFNGMTPTGMPALVRIDPSVDFTWGDPGGPGAPLGTDQFSARWTADLEIAIADTYTFATSSDDGVRVWLNDKLIINNWTDHGTTMNKSTPIALEPGIYPLQMEYYENGGGAVARLFWETPTVAQQIITAGPLQPPLRARALYPAHGDVNVPQDATLSWGAGEKASKHNVYFGEDKDAVANATTDTQGIYRGQQALNKTTFDPGTLAWNKTYYWRIDEVNDTTAGSPWKGTVWSFTTADFIVVDDMESYGEPEGTRLYEFWIDGYADQSNGAIVGYMQASNGTFGETVIVHGGKQSMPMEYDNSKAPYFSEAYQEFAPVQDWTANGVTDLVLFVRGYPAAASVAVTETGGKMSLTGAGADIWNNSDEFTYAYKSLNGDGTLVAKVVSNGTGSNRWAKGGVMVRDSINGGSTHAMMVLTGGDGNGASFQYRAATDGASANNDSGTAVAPPYWVKIERLGDSLTGYLSSNGTTWAMVGTTIIAMDAPVYIGICVTSHQAGENRTFQFENIASTGAVSGAWQGAVINAPMHNSGQPLYVRVEDSAGKKATATDATAVTANAWTEVKMPLSGFTGVNLAKVKKLVVGVGDPAAPAADGNGRIFIDDIRVTKP